GAAGPAGHLPPAPLPALAERDAGEAAAEAPRRLRSLVVAHRRVGARRWRLRGLAPGPRRAVPLPRVAERRGAGGTHEVATAEQHGALAPRVVGDAVRAARRRARDLEPGPGCAVPRPRVLQRAA